ncbi:Major facilitator superfamily (MFS) profile domain-containing protein, partial [Dysosmobacter welbionis]
RRQRGLLGPHRQEPQAPHHLPDPGPGPEDGPGDLGPVRRRSPHRHHPGEGPLQELRGRHAGDLPAPASRRAPHGGGQRDPDPQPVLRPPALRPVHRGPVQVQQEAVPVAAHPR